jgi:sugar phosphate isomerase/epimerase
VVYDFFKSIVKICEDHEIYFCLEPNAKEYGCNFLNSTKEVIDYVISLNSNFAKINFDTGCVLMNNEDPVKILAYAFPYVGHIHISSPMLKPVHSNSMDHSSIANFLKRKKYEGGVAIEMLTSTHCDKSKDQITEAVAVLKNFYQ